MTSSKGRNVKTDGLFLGTLILSIALGLVIWYAGDQSPWVLLLVPVTFMGVYLLVASFMMPRSSKIGASPSSYYFVWGAIVTAAGALGLLRLLAGVDWIVIGAAFLAVFAVIIIWRSVSSRD